MQAEAVAQALAGNPVAAVYTSPLERARVCADLIAKPHRLEPRVEPDLREMSFGAWEGLGGRELPAGDAEAWRRPPHLDTPPRGGTLRPGAARVPSTRAPP